MHADNEDEAEKWREQLQKMKQEWESNKEFMDCWNEFKKRNGGTMKKYIRTEKSIFELKDNMKISFEKLFEDISNEVGSMYGTEEWVCYGKVLQQADTIEELCDEVVIKRTNTLANKTWYSNFPMEHYQDVKDCMIDNHLDYIKIDYVKFGIWNDDKGLIYVAKMNENGDLVLI